VRFVEQIEAMYAAGARVFVEAGPGRILSGLVRRILGDRPHAALAVDDPGQDGWSSLGHLLAQAFALGLPVDLAPWFAARSAGTSGLEKTLADARPKIYWRASQIAPLEPDLAAQVGSILDTIAERADDFEQAPTTFVHGSPSPKQFLVDGQRVSLVDFDGARIGDPAADLGAFMATMAKYELKAARPEVLLGLDEPEVEDGDEAEEEEVLF